MHESTFRNNTQRLRDQSIPWQIEFVATVTKDTTSNNEISIKTAHIIEKKL